MAKILLVEDDKSLREIYGVRLLAEGYDIVSAGDGEEALAMAIKDRPDLIISDVMMPKISGFDMLDILRSTTETKAIKVIMMTALSSEDQRARGEALGADRYLVKSQVGIEDVVRTVHEVLADGATPAVPAKNPFETPVPAAPAVPAPDVAPTPLPTEPRPAPVAVPPARQEPIPEPTPEPLPEPVAPVPLPTPTIPEPMATPQAPAPSMTVPEPAPVAPPTPQPLPVPTPAAVAPTPVPSPAPIPMPTPSTTPYTAAQPTLAERVITPLSPAEQPVDMGDLMNQELSGVNGQAQPPTPPLPPTPPAAV